MAVKWEAVKAGDELWGRARHACRIKIVEINHAGGWATVRFFDREVRWSRRMVERLRRTPRKEGNRG